MTTFSAETSQPDPSLCSMSADPAVLAETVRDPYTALFILNSETRRDVEKALSHVQEAPPCRIFADYDLLMDAIDTDDIAGIIEVLGTKDPSVGELLSNITCDRDYGSVGMIRTEGAYFSPLLEMIEQMHAEPRMNE